NPFTQLFSLASVKIVPFTFVTEYPIARFSFLMPRAVTTTSCKVPVVDARLTLMLVWLPTLIRCGSYPTKEKTRYIVFISFYGIHPLLIAGCGCFFPFY